MRRLTLLMVAAVFASAAHAELYSWREGGSTRYSNVAPPWYSATEPARIRTRVTLNGILVDDTGLPMDQRDQLRAQRTKAEAWNKPGALVPPPNMTPPVAPVAPDANAVAKPPAPPPMGVKPGEAPAKPADPAKAAAAPR